MESQREPLELWLVKLIMLLFSVLDVMYQLPEKYVVLRDMHLANSAQSAQNISPAQWLLELIFRDLIYRLLQGA